MKKYKSILLISTICLLFSACGDKKESSKIVKQKDISKKLFTQCSKCHGKLAQNHAMGKSKIMRDLSKEEIISAIKGYRNGTYGKLMKSTKKQTFAHFTDRQIEQLATYIKTLK